MWWKTKINFQSKKPYEDLFRDVEQSIPDELNGLQSMITNSERMDFEHWMRHIILLSYYRQSDDNPQLSF